MAAAPPQPGMVPQQQRRHSDPALYEIRRRSAALSMDPKAQELRHFLGSHRHEARLRDAAGLNNANEDPLAEAVRLMSEVDAINYCEERYDPLQACKARLDWRAEMDRNLRRLMQDQDLMLDDRMHEASKHQLRCESLDKTYAWFERHGKKEASKERPAPAFLRFDEAGPIMPGSLRRETGQRGWTPKPLTQLGPDSSRGKPTSQVSPTLMAAAAQAVSAPPTTPGGATTRTFATTPALQSSPTSGSMAATSRPTSRSKADSRWVPYG